MKHADRAIWFDGVCSAEFGIVVSGEQRFDAPERDIEQLSIPGRNGCLTIDNGRYKNIEISYNAGIQRDFLEVSQAVRSWLTSPVGYRRFEDSIDPEHFRLAAFRGPLRFELGFLCGSATFSLSFDCAPQRFLKSGEFPVIFQAPGVLYNGTAFVAKPLITVSGSGAGSLTVGGVTVGILSLDGSLSLDCDTQNAYKGHQNKNNTISAPVFPVLSPGENQISWTGGVTGVEITPRWWTL